MPYLINNRFVRVNSYTLIDLKECKLINIEVPDKDDDDELTENDIEDFFREYETSVRE